MRVVEVGVQEADRDRLHALRGERVGRRRHRFLIERQQHGAGRIDAFRNLMAALARDQRDRRADGVVIQMRADLAADLQHVAEAPGGDQAGRHAAALDHHVGGDGGAVADEIERGGRDGAVAQDRAEAVGDRLRRVGRGGWQLEVVQRAAGGVVQGEVREAAADVEANAHDGSPVRPRRLRGLPSPGQDRRTSGATA